MANATRPTDGGFTNARRPLSAGIYGAGAFGRYIAHCLASSPEVRINAIASRSPERARETSLLLDIPKWHRSYAELLADSDLDAIVVATIPAQHAGDAIEALRAGKHVVVEKPLATKLEDARSVIAEAADRDRVIAVDFPLPHTAVVKALVALVGSAAAGALHRIDLENLASCEDLGDTHWFWDAEASGGIFIEHGVHFFDWCGSLLAPPQRVTAWRESVRGREDRVFAAVSHAGGALATYYHAFVTRREAERTRTRLAFAELDVVVEGWIPTSMKLSGPAAKDAAEVIRAAQPALIPTVGGFGFSAGPKPAAYADAVRSVFREFSDVIAGVNRAPIVSTARVLLGLRVAEAAARAARDGATQIIDAGEPIAGPSSLQPSAYQ